MHVRSWHIANRYYWRKPMFMHPLHKHHILLYSLQHQLLLMTPPLYPPHCPRPCHLTESEGAKGPLTPTLVLCVASNGRLNVAYCGLSAQSVGLGCIENATLPWGAEYNGRKWPLRGPNTHVQCVKKRLIIFTNITLCKAQLHINASTYHLLLIQACLQQFLTFPFQVNS